MATRTIIGIVGTNSSGKDTIADFLVEKYGFVNISTGDMLRKHIKDNSLGEIDRDTLQRVGNELRAQHGSDVLARKALENSASRLIISGIRSIGEAKAVKDAEGQIISCDAPVELRYERAQSRGRIGDEITLEKFKAQEEVEKSDDPNGMNVPAVIAMSDFQIINDGTLEELGQKIEETAVQIGLPKTL